MITRKQNLGIIMLMTLGLIAAPAMADRDNDNDPRFRDRIITTDRTWAEDVIKEKERQEKRDQRDQRDQRGTRDRRDDRNQHDREYKERGYVYDSRHHHDRYYPPRGYVYRTLPRNYRIAPYRGVDYYFYSGVWYRHSGVGFSVVLPPVGVIVSALPPYYTTLWVDATPYYYAGGVYYVWQPSLNGYQVVEAPDENKIETEIAMPQELFVYPKQGQSEEKQANDRYECHRWAADQTSFDPTQPGGNVPAGQHADKRADYQRAMTACLEGRGYSVK